MNTSLPVLASDRPFLPPRSDLLFKKIFGDERNTDLLVGFLQPVLGLPDADWARLALPDTHTLSRQAEDKTAVLDVKVTTATGRHVDIEVQLFPTRDLAARLVYYTSSMVVSQLTRGRAYESINQAICLLITDFVMFDDEHRHHRFVYHDPDRRTTLTDLTVIHVLELPKLTDVDDGTVEWQWLRFIAARTPEEMAMAAADNPQIARAATLVTHYNADEQLRYEIEARERFLHDQASRQLTAHQDGFDQGQQSKAISVARNALGMGMSVEQVSELTGLSTTEITQLAQEL